MSRRPKKKAVTSPSHQASEELYQTLFEQAADGIFIADAQGRYVEVNRRGCEMLGYTREEILDFSINDLIPADDLSRDPLQLDELRTGKVILKERRLRCKDGRILPVEINAQMLADGSFLGMVRDISRRKQAEQELQRSNDLLRAIIEAAPVAIVGLDPEGNVQMAWNPAAEKMLGWKAQEVMGRPLPCVPVESQEEFRRFREQIHSGKTLDGVEVRRQRRDGSPIDYSIYASPLHDAQGRISGNIAVLVEITERKLAEEALKASEARYIDLYENAPDMYASVNAQTGTIEKCNQTLVDVLGRQKEEIIGRPVFEIYHPDCRDQAKEVFKEFRERGEIRDKELQLLRKDGSKLDVSLNVSAVRAGDGTILFSRSTLRDITERKRNDSINSARLHLIQFAVTHSLDELLEETLNEAEKLTDSLIGFYHFVEANQKTLTLQNWSTRTKAEFCKAEGKGMHYPIAEAGVWVDCVYQRKPVIHNHYASLHHRKGMPAGHAEVVRELVVPVLREKKIKAILGVGNKPTDYTEKDVEAISLLADLAWEIAERKKAEEALKASEAELRTLINAMTDVILVVNAEGRYLKIAESSPSLLYKPAKELLGKTLHEIFPKDQADIFLNSVTQALYTRKPINLEYSLPIGDKNYWFNATVSPMSDDTILLVARDITERKQLEAENEQLTAQFYQTQKMESIGRLAGGIAHDFNNLLVPIISYIDLSLADLRPESKLCTYLTTVRRAAERAADLTRQILAFSRQHILELRLLDFNVIIEEFKKILQRLIGEDIELQTSLSPSLFPVKADKGQVEQILMNLAINSRDAMPAGGKLTIETVNAFLDESFVEKYASGLIPGHYAMLAVSDTGQGMDAEAQKRIFEPFFTTKSSGKGTGLGLATVFGIVKQHRGHIAVYSEPGQGTTFKIYLPKAKDSIQTITTVPKEPLSIYGTETVLVVEDDEMVRKLVCETLESHGYDVVEAQTPTDCLELASGKTTIHLLLTDVVMPEMNGKELCQKIGAIHPNIRVLYMSGYTTNVVARHSILDEGSNFLQKPFTIRDLTRKVREVLD